MAESSAPLIFGPYALIERIASGGMAEVYVAKRQGPHGFHKTVAVKRILPQLAQDQEFVAMFVDEARVVASLSHPNIVQVFDFGEADGELYMAMEYVRGTNAARLVRLAAAKGEVIPLDVCLHIALSVLRGLEYAHRARDEAAVSLHLVHRDVSPGNVLMDESGTVKLTDFGIARAANFERRTAVGHLKGKLGYMSPEQVSGLELDARSDLFTLGIVLAELLTLRPLFTATTELEVLTRIRDADVAPLDAAALPADVHAILRRALARLPEDRYPTAQAFADDVEALARARGLSLGAPRLASFLARLSRDSGHPPDPHTAKTAAKPPPPAADSEPDREGEGDAEWADERATPHLVSYRLQKPDGKTLGPLAYHDLAELFATGAIDTRALVARDEGPYEPPRVFPELMRFFSSSALLWSAPSPSAERTRHPLDRVTLPGWLFRLAAARKTGAVLVRDGGRRKTIFLAHGVPEFASSTDKREFLGEHLIAKGRVLRSEVEMALSILPRFGGRLGDALVGLGLLRPVELFRVIHEQTLDRYLELFRWRQGELAFASGVTSEEESFPLGVDPLELVARGVRERYDSGEIAEWLERLGDELIAPVPSPPFRLEALTWTDGELLALRALGNARPLRRFLAERGGLGDPEVVRGVYLGLSFGLLATARFEIPDPLA